MAQLYQNTGIIKEVPSLLSCNLRDRSINETTNSQMFHWYVMYHGHSLCFALCEARYSHGRRPKGGG